MGRLEKQYKQWSAKVRLDAKGHCSEIWMTTYRGNYINYRKTNIKEIEKLKRGRKKESERQVRNDKH